MSGAINGDLPTIVVAGSGEPGDPYNLTLNNAWAQEVASGWHHIDSGTAADLTVNVPAGVKGVRVRWQAVNSVSAYLQARINGDASAGLHIRSDNTITPTGSFAGVADGVGGNSYHAGEFLASLIAWGEMQFWPLNLRVPMESRSFRQGIPGGSARHVGFGLLNADRILSSIVLIPSTGTLSTCEWQAEAYF